MNEMNQPEVPLAGIVYGNIIYWLTVVVAVMALIGLMLTFMTDINYVDANHMLSGIWQGQSVKTIWETSTVAALPPEHWYLRHLLTGDGLSAFALSLGVFSVIPATFAAAWLLLRDGQKIIGGFAIVAGMITLLAMTGLIMV